MAYQLFRSPRLLMLVAATLLLFLTLRTTAFQFQQDTIEDCVDRLPHCNSSQVVWYECPASCSDIYHEEGNMAEYRDDPEAFFRLEANMANGKKLDLEDLEGYVTIYAVVPLVPGMAQFYYDLLEHVANIFPYTVEVLLLPIQVSEGDDSQLDSEVRIQPHTKTKRRVILLEETGQSTDELDYLLGAKIVAGNDRSLLYLDRVTTFLVSADGMFVERLISPTLSLLERRASVFLKQLEWSPEL